MNSFRSYMLRVAYANIQRLGDRLAKADQLIDWNAFRPIISGMHRNGSERGGRPNLDEVMMMKLLVIQQWYGLSDPELERQAADRISFQRFLGFPEEPPDYSTVWQFRERLAEEPDLGLYFLLRSLRVCSSPMSLCSFSSRSLPL